MHTFRCSQLPAVWKLTRRLATHNRYFPTIEDVIIAVEHTFESWRKGSDTLGVYAQLFRTLCIEAFISNLNWRHKP